MPPRLLNATISINLIYILGRKRALTSIKVTKIEEANKARRR
jgi:hypothetical protein